MNFSLIKICFYAVKSRLEGGRVSIDDLIIYSFTHHSKLVSFFPRRYIAQQLTVTCPQNQIAASNSQSKAVYYSAATAIGGTSTYNYQSINPSGSIFNRGVTTVTITASSGTLSGTCTFTVTLNG